MGLFEDHNATQCVGKDDWDLITRVLINTRPS